VAAPRRVQRDRGGAGTARLVSVRVLQHSVTPGGNSSPGYRGEHSGARYGKPRLGQNAGLEGGSVFGHFGSYGIGV